MMHVGADRWQGLTWKEKTMFVIALTVVTEYKLSALLMPITV